MTNLRLAISDPVTGPLHAAALGDDQSICGHRLDSILAEPWDAAPQSQTCARCQHAVDVLRTIHAV